MSIAQPTSQRTSLLATAISVLTAPVMWFLHFNAAYAIVDFGCRAEGSGGGTLVSLILIATVAALIPILLVGVYAVRLWRQSEARVVPEGDQDARDTHERRRFVAFLGVILTAVFTTGILVTTTPVFFVSVCEGIVA